MQEELEELIDMYTLSPEQFEEYRKNIIMMLTTGVQPVGDKKEVLMIVGGQPGAGKTRLSSAIYEELQKNVVKVDFDELRGMHPYYQTVCASYPSIVHRILADDTNNVKKEAFKYLIENGYNVIYEGALRDTQGFVDFAKQFKENGYNVNLNIMAVPELESYGSTFVRYAAEIMTNGKPRWVEKELHDASYNGVIETAKAFEEENISDEIRVFVRGNDVNTDPKKIYSSLEKQYKDAATAIKLGREDGRKKAVDDFLLKYQFVVDVFKMKCPELLEKLKQWKELYESEQKHFEALSIE